MGPAHTGIEPCTSQRLKPAPPNAGRRTGNHAAENSMRTAAVSRLLTNNSLHTSYALRDSKDSLKLPQLSAFSPCSLLWLAPRANTQVNRTSHVGFKGKSCGRLDLFRPSRLF